MSSFSTIVILLTLAAASLFIVSVINQRQTRARVVSQKLSSMKRRVSDMEELVATLQPLVENPAIPKIINEEAIDLTNTMLGISPSNNYYQMTLGGLEQRAQEFSDPSKKVALYRLMESDAAIARAQYAMSEAARIVRKRQAADQIQVAEMDALLRDISWANFMVKITSNVAQGHKAVNRGDVLRAFAFYRKALEVATEAGHKDERQNQIITEIGEILSSKRRALSLSLMPETTHNPEADTPGLAELSRAQAEKMLSEQNDDS
ncbi:MAG: hypothetical protein K6L76_01165 [Agarilytica sp.]